MTLSSRKLSAVLLFAAVAISSSPTASANSEQTPAVMSRSDSAIKKVDNKLVCMVTDMVFPRVQIPVTVGKKTYYGCCENCKTRLGEDASVREAIDPVTGKKVDKATAVIGALSDGSVRYFENEANLNAFKG